MPKTVDMFLSGIGRTGMRYVPVISFPRAIVNASASSFAVGREQIVNKSFVKMMDELG